jgi:hypothetical protein
MKLSEAGARPRAMGTRLWYGSPYPSGFSSRICEVT